MENIKDYIRSLDPVMKIGILLLLFTFLVFSMIKMVRKFPDDDKNNVFGFLRQVMVVVCIFFVLRWYALII